MKDENELLQEAYELYRAGMAGAALAVCEEIKARPDHSAQAYYYAGMACIRLGLINQAITNLKEAVRREPNNGDFHSGLSAAYSNRGSFPWGRRAQKQALQGASRLRAETAPEWQRQTTYGKLAETEGHWDRALACYHLALPYAPSPQFVQTLIGRALNHQRRWQEARDVMRDVVRHPTQDPSPWFILGRSEWKMGDRDAASEAFERAAALYPYNQRAWYYLAKISFGRGQWRRGFHHFGTMCRIIFQTSMQDQEEAAKKKSTSKG